MGRAYRGVRVRLRIVHELGVHVVNKKDGATKLTQFNGKPQQNGAVLVDTNAKKIYISFDGLLYGMTAERTQELIGILKHSVRVLEGKESPN